MEILQLGLIIGGGVVGLIVIIIAIVLCRKCCNKKTSSSVEGTERESLVSLQEIGKEGLIKDAKKEPQPLNNNIEVNLEVNEEKPKLRAAKKEQKEEKKEEPPIVQKEEPPIIKNEEPPEEKKEEPQEEPKEEKKEEKTIYDQILSINDTKTEEENNKKNEAEDERNKNLDSEEEIRRNRLKTIAEANEDMRESFYDRNPPVFADVDIKKEYDNKDNEEVPVEPENKTEEKTETTTQEEPKQEEPKQEEQKQEEPKQDEPKQEANNENVINDNNNSINEDKKEEPKIEEKKEEEKKEEHKKKFPPPKKSFRRLNSDSQIGTIRGEDAKGVEDRKSRMLKRLNKARSKAKEIDEENRRPKKSESIQKKATLYQEKLFHNLSLVDKND